VPHLDLVFGTHGVYRLPELVKRAQQKRTVDIGLSSCFPEVRRQEWPAGRVQTLVTIMQGCNNFCSFCVVPYVRGREFSREPADIEAEVKGFLAAGGKEVTLLGQNVNSYGQGLTRPVTFVDLVRRLAALPGLARLRFATSHPKDLSGELIEAFGELPALCEHLHLPVQSGSDRILAAMNRRYTREHYLDKVRRLKQVCPGINLSTDLIVGFPGETENDFQDTLALMQEAGFGQSFSFKYSPRPNTRAAEFPGQVPEPVKGERLRRLQALQDDLIQAAHQGLLGQVKEVLVEGQSKRSSGQLCGRLRTNQVVNFTGPQELSGRLAMVEITEAHPHSLKGRWVQEMPAR
jgi:tRNA-2-methylthio-N6-dimethylallyladenosine synthase